MVYLYDEEYVILKKKRERYLYSDMKLFLGCILNNKIKLKR